MKAKRIIKFLLIGFIAGFFLSLFLWEKYLSSDEVITLYDTTRVEVQVEIPIPYEVISYKYHVDTVFKPVLDTFLQEVILPIDTSEIIAEYVKKRVYIDTIVDDDLVAYLNEDIQFNKITNRDFSYQILRPMYIKQEKLNTIGVGMSYYGTFIPNVSYNYKNWGVSVGWNQEIYLGVQYSLIEF